MLLNRVLRASVSFGIVVAPKFANSLFDKRSAESGRKNNAFCPGSASANAPDFVLPLCLPSPSFCAFIAPLIFFASNNFAFFSRLFLLIFSNISSNDLLSSEVCEARNCVSVLFASRSFVVVVVVLSYSSSSSSFSSSASS